MANSILGSGATPSGAPAPAPSQQMNPMQMLQQFQQFRNSFKGNPQQMIQQMLQSGKISNPQLQQAMQMAKQFQQFVK